MIRRSRLVAVAALTVVLAAAAPATANAAPPSPGERARAVANAVFNASDPAAAAKKLNKTDRDLLAQGLTLDRETVTVTVEPIDVGVARDAFLAGGQFAAAAASYDACFSRSASGAGKNVFGGVLYDYYTTLYYCAKDGKIAMAKWTRQTGQVRFIGWFYDGKISDQIDYTARTIGGYSQFKFHSGPISQLPIQNAYPCLQTRVDSSGVAMSSSACYA